jgi:hypothetical protein
MRVGAGIGGAHEKVAGRDPRERWGYGERQGRILFLPGERLLERCRIVAADHAAGNDSDGNVA